MKVRVMSIESLFVILVIGTVAGWLAGRLTNGGGFGLAGNAIVGVAGAMLAGFLLPGVLPVNGVTGQVISATIGAVIVVFLLQVLRRV